MSTLSIREICFNVFCASLYCRARFNGERRQGAWSQTFHEQMVSRQTVNFVFLAPTTEL